MRVIQINTTDGAGGAGRAARRLHESLRRSGVDSSMVVGSATIGGADVTEISAAVRDVAGRGPRLEKLLPRVNRFTGELALPYPSSHLFSRTRMFKDSDIVNLHNIHGNYFDYRVLPRWAARRPLVWTLHDMWPLTGHCAFSLDCHRWKSGCGKCPLFLPNMKALDAIPQPPWDNSAQEWRRKQGAYARTPLTVVAPSRWLMDLASRSILGGNPGTTFHQVPYGLDTATYRPIPKQESRRLLGLEPNRPILFFGAAHMSHERKGLRHLVNALQDPRLEARGLQLVTMGQGGGLGGELPDVRHFGAVNDAALQAVIYSAADVAVVPSIADNQPLVALEAMACGTPVVAFDAGGLPEVVRDGQTGFCVPGTDARGLASAVAKLLSSPELLRRCSDGARRVTLDEHGLDRYARSYREIYDEQLARYHSSRKRRSDR